jgi:PAS domain S-box-containing protein
MDHSKKSREELISEVNALRLELEKAKSAYEIDVASRKMSEQILFRRSEMLSALNKYMMELEEQSQENIHKYIVFKSKDLFKVRGVWISVYNEATSELEVKESTASPRENTYIKKYMGIDLTTWQTHIDDDRYKLIIETGSGVFASLNQITFGLISNSLSEIFKRIFGIGWFQGITLVEEGKLYGSMIFAGCRGQEVLDNDILKIFADVTSSVLRRKKIEYQLKMSEDKFRKAFVTSPDSININRLSDGEYISVNNGFTRITGYTEDEVIGKTSAELRIWVDPEDRKKMVNEILKSSEASSIEARFRTKTGQIIEGIMSATLIELNGVKHVLNITRDVTERKKDLEQLKKSEAEIKELNAKLEQRVVERTAQLEAANNELQAFAYSVSHDLRAPLRAISGFSRFVLEDYGSKLDEEGQRLLGLIRSNTVKMDKLITDILSLSKVARGENKKSQIDMTRMAISMFNEAAPESRERINISINDMPGIFADPTYIKQVWINLFSNAVKFSSLRDISWIEAGGYPDGNFNTYYVKDNGVGFNQEYSNKLFAVFQRLHKTDEFEGTGVGLAIVQRIIHRHEGKVWAESVEGEGATFYFSLPVNR